MRNSLVVLQGAVVEESMRRRYAENFGATAAESVIVPRRDS
jgi:hypothetical protein